MGSDPDSMVVSSNRRSIRLAQRDAEKMEGERSIRDLSAMP